MLTVCNRSLPPGAVCASALTQQTLTTLIFGGGERQIDRVVSGNPTVDWPAVKADLRSLRTDNLFSYDLIVFKGFDKDTKMVRCSASVHITLPAKYKTETFTSVATNMTNSRAPPELFGDRPEVPVDYTIQRDVLGKNDVVSSDSLAPLFDSLLILAVAKWRTALFEPHQAP